MQALLGGVSTRVGLSHVLTAAVWSYAVNAVTGEQNGVGVANGVANAATEQAAEQLNAAHWVSVIFKDIKSVF